MAPDRGLIESRGERGCTEHKQGRTRVDGSELGEDRTDYFTLGSKEARCRADSEQRPTGHKEPSMCLSRKCSWQDQTPAAGLTFRAYTVTSSFPSPRLCRFHFFSLEI